MLDGPILFLSHSLHAPGTLVEVAKFASASRRDLKIILKLPKRTAPAIAKKHVDIWRESLSADLRHLPIEAVLPQELQSFLYKNATKSAGLLCLEPTRRGNPIRTFTHNDYERFLIDGPLPVLALPRGGNMPKLSNVLFPADLSPRSDGVLNDTISLCKDHGATLHILHVFGPDKRLPSEMDMAARQATQSPRELFALDQEHLAELGARATAQGVTAIVSFAEGRADSEILRYAREKAINLIVMATHGPRTAADIFAGSTTIRTILTSPLPIIGVQS